MEGLNRKILYDKKAPAQPVKIAAPPVVPGKDLIQWLADHPLINISGLAAACGIDRGNLTKYIKTGKIPAIHEKKIAQVLINYGFN